MKAKRVLLAVMLIMGFMLISVSTASSEEVKYELKPGATIKALLTDSIGKRVVLRLESGEEMEGTVTAVGEHLVHVAKLSKRDFFDAYVSIERISAVIIRVR